MENIILVLYVIICILIVVFLDKPQTPEPIDPVLPPPEPFEETVRAFSWIMKSVSMSKQLSTTVAVRNEAYEASRQALLYTFPSKALMFTDRQYFDIAMKEILHPDFGSSSYEINQITSYLNSIANKELLSDIEFAGLILSFTQEQCIRYESDKDSTGYPEYFRFPLETVYDTVGDCDCKAILACSLFKKLGFRVAFALMPGHAALAITIPDDDLPFSNFFWKGKKWFYCEATGDGWLPGTLPTGIRKHSVELEEV